MSDPINANPTILDVSQLPKRHDLSKHQGEESEEALVYSRILPFSLLSASSKKHKNHVHSDIYEDLTITPDLVGDYSSSDEDDASDLMTETEAMDLDSEYEEEEEEPIDAQEVYDLISSISDPEHPLTLGQLAVVNLADIQVTDPRDKSKIGEVLIKITPTITHCSLATLIGLGIRVRLERCLPSRLRIVILLKEGSHQSEHQVNKQLNDKERVSAACENEQLLKVISHMLSTCQ